MSEQKDGQGSYTSIPNVFFDTCDLPETAQILYLRLYKEIHFKDCKFVGSIRKLSKLVRLSKSTVERMTKKLQEAGLISIEYQEGDEVSREVMTITLHKENLWNANRHHHQVEPVPNWDKKMPDCPNVGQSRPDLGRNRPNMGQSVPGSSSKVGQTITNTTNKSKTYSSFSNHSQKSSVLTSQEKQKERMDKLLAGKQITKEG